MVMVMVLGAVLPATVAAADAGAMPACARVEVFHTPGCPHCAAVRAFLAALGREFPSLQVIERDVRQDAGAERAFRDRMQRLPGVSAGVPLLDLCGTLVIGFSRALQVALGLAALLVGAINLKDFVAPGVGVSLSIPARAKPGLYARVRAIVHAQNLAGAVAAVIVLALLVNMLELLCTAGLPALYTQVLSRQGSSTAGYHAYLGLYNVAYMFDDALMVAVVTWTLRRTKVQERAGRWLELLSGVTVGLLGIALLLAPQWLF